MDDDLKKMLEMKWWNITAVPEKVIIRKTRIKRIFQ